MKNIRTTITLPLELHDELRTQAFTYRKSLNEVIVDKLREKPEKEYSANSIENEIEEDWNFFRKVSKMGNHIDATQVVREERDR